MRLERVSMSLVGFIAIVSVALALAAIWLFMTQPATVANAVTNGEMSISPLISSLASVILDALSGLLKYL